MKVKITDAHGETFEVEELDDDETTVVEEQVENSAETSLTSEELSSLKRLAAVADKLVALTSDIHDEDKDEVDVDINTDEDEEEDDEEIIDTTCHDSKKSLGKVEKKVKPKDSQTVEDEVAAAWQKRYGGKH